MGAHFWCKWFSSLSPFLYKTLFAKLRFKKLKIETVFPLVTETSGIAAVPLKNKLQLEERVLAIFDLSWENIHIESCSVIKQRSFLSRQFSLWFHLRLSLRSLQHAYVSVWVQISAEGEIFYICSTYEDIFLLSKIVKSWIVSCILKAVQGIPCNTQESKLKKK